MSWLCSSSRSASNLPGRDEFHKTNFKERTIDPTGIFLLVVCCFVWVFFNFIFFFKWKLQVLLRCCANNWTWQPVASISSLLGVGESLEASWGQGCGSQTPHSHLKGTLLKQRQLMRLQGTSYRILLQVYRKVHVCSRSVEQRCKFMNGDSKEWDLELFNNNITA